MDSIPQKRCTRCEQPKPTTDFHRNKTNPDGLQNHCKECRKDEKYRPRQIDLEHRGQKKCPKCKEWKPATTEFFYARRGRRAGLDAHCKVCRATARKPEKTSLYNRRWREAHVEERKASVSDKTREAVRRSYYAHPETRQRYRKTHRIERQALENKRRALKASNGGIYTKQDVQDKFSRQKGRCYYCQQKLTKYHIDHVVPLSRGGSNDQANLVLACPSCNASKKDNLLHEWHRSNKLL